MHEKSILNFVQDSGIPGILYFCYSDRIRSEETIHLGILLTDADQNPALSSCKRDEKRLHAAYADRRLTVLFGGDADDRTYGKVRAAPSSFRSGAFF